MLRGKWQTTMNVQYLGCTIWLQLQGRAGGVFEGGKKQGKKKAEKNATFQGQWGKKRVPEVDQSVRIRLPSAEEEEGFFWNIWFKNMSVVE